MPSLLLPPNMNNKAIQHGAPEGLFVADCVCILPRVRLVFLPALEIRILRIRFPAVVWTSHDRYQEVAWKTWF